MHRPESPTARHARPHRPPLAWLAALASLALLAAALPTTALAQGGDAGQAMTDAERATMYLDLVREQHYDYTWHYETDVPAGYYKGTPPHGGVLRTFMNDIAFDASRARAGAYPPGSMFVKENHMPVEGVAVPPDKSTAIAGFPGNLAAVTIMAKISGYNPDAGDWFFAKLQPDGTVDAAGRVESCAACHATVKGNDFVYDAAVK
jgi:hypothetical protein